MANTKQATKYLRQTERRTASNRIVKSRLKTLQRKAESASAHGDSAAFDAVARDFISASDKAVKSGVIHKNKADRSKARVSRLKQQLAQG